MPEQGPQQRILPQPPGDQRYPHGAQRSLGHDDGPDETGCPLRRIAAEKPADRQQREEARRASEGSAYGKPRLRVGLV
jgi:hypothetical protein